VLDRFETARKSSRAGRPMAKTMSFWSMSVRYFD